jgi:hypothetical protein
MLLFSLPTNPDPSTGPIREATEIALHPNDMNREDGFSVRRSWNSLTHSMTKRKKFLSMKNIVSSSYYVVQYGRFSQTFGKRQSLHILPTPRNGSDDLPDYTESHHRSQ